LLDVHPVEVLLSAQIAGEIEVAVQIDELNGREPALESFFDGGVIRFTDSARSPETR